MIRAVQRVTRSQPMNGKLQIFETQGIRRRNPRGCRARRFACSFGQLHKRLFPLVGRAFGQRRDRLVETFPVAPIRVE